MKNLPNDALASVENIKEAKHRCGGSTVLVSALDKMTSLPEKFDRVIILSDMQSYNDGGWSRNNNSGPEQICNKYRENKNPKLWIHSLDLAGQGTSRFDLDHDKKVNLIAGWSDKVLDFISSVENGTQTIVDAVKAVKLS
jgi:hypothetical protein